MCRRHNVYASDCCSPLRWICSIPRYYINVSLALVVAVRSFLFLSVSLSTRNSEVKKSETRLQKATCCTHTNTQRIPAFSLFLFALTEGWRVHRAPEDATVQHLSIHYIHGSEKTNKHIGKGKPHLNHPPLFMQTEHELCDILTGCMFALMVAKPWNSLSLSVSVHLFAHSLLQSLGFRELCAVCLGLT